MQQVLTQVVWSWLNWGHSGICVEQSGHLAEGPDCLCQIPWKGIFRLKHNGPVPKANSHGWPRDAWIFFEVRYQYYNKTSQRFAVIILCPSCTRFWRFDFSTPKLTTNWSIDATMHTVFASAHSWDSSTKILLLCEPFDSWRSSTFAARDITSNQRVFNSLCFFCYWTIWEVWILNPQHQRTLSSWGLVPETRCNSFAANLCYPFWLKVE